MSVQPALAEAVGLAEMQTEAFDGAHWERQLIQAFTRLKKKGCATIVAQVVSSLLCYRATFLSAFLMPLDSAGFSKIQDILG